MKLTLQIKRKLIQIAAFGFTNIHITNFASGKIYTGKWKNFCTPGMNCYSCPAASFACPIGAMQAVGGSYKYDFSFYVWGMLLAIGVVFGRAICGFVCPFGLIQELLHKIPVPKKKLWKGLKYVKYILLVVFVLLLPVAVTDYMGMGKPAYCEFICPSGTLEGGIPLLLTHPELRQTIGSLFYLKLTILIGVLVLCMFFYRFFCRVMCPLGAIYGLLNRFSFYRIHLDSQNCVHCGKCAKCCPMDVDPVANPNSAECIRCGLCASQCPKKAITVGFRGTKRAEKCKLPK